MRLKGSSGRLEPAHLPEPFIDAVTETFREEEDVYTILATYSYIFCNLRVNDICDMFVLSDRYGVRKASREYIRQKIISSFRSIRSVYHRDNGDLTQLAAVVRESNMSECSVYLGVSCISTEERSEDDSSNEAKEREV